MAAPQFKLTVTASDNTQTIFSDTSDTDRTDDSGLVISFEGEEHISRLFEYRLKLEYHVPTSAPTSGPAFDFSKLVNQKAVLTMEQGALKAVDESATPLVAADPNVPTNFEPTMVNIEGVLSSFCVTHKVSDGVLACEAVLVPKLWRLGMSLESRVFQEKPTHEIVHDVLVGAGLSSTTDFEFKLSGTAYPIREFCMQYQESDLDFIQRLLEYEGIFYYFDGGKLIFSDDKALPEVEGRKGVWFRPPADMASEDHVYSFIYSEQVVPNTVAVLDHDFESFLQEKQHDTNTDLSGSGEIHARVGTRKEHGRFVATKRNWAAEQGADPDGKLGTDAQATVSVRDSELVRIATLRAQELEARRKTATARSTAARIQPGHHFDLTDHFLFSDTYLVTTVRHVYEAAAYHNEFTCLAAAVQYRPPRATPVPRVPGVITAKVKGSDAADDDAEPNIDEEGRYRVRFPFDPNAATATEPSRLVRLAQPYAGKDYGMHFPNRGEVEMVLACLDGDPDRPLGLSVVPTPWKHAPVRNTDLKLGSQNPTTGSSATPGGNYQNAVTDSSQSHDYTFQNTKSVIRTKVGHQLVMDDADGGANVGITLQVGNAVYASKTGAETDKYWGSKIELGGYRHLSVLERILGIASTAVGYFRNVFTRDFPGMASSALAIVASQVTTDNYADDTFGSTTPVGVNIYTNKDVRVTGKDGVHITSPNIFGMFSSSMIPGDSKDRSTKQYSAEAISKFIINTVWQEVINGTADELMESRETEKEYDANVFVNPKVKEAFKWKENFLDQRISALFFTLLQHSGVNISSMGELKLASLQSTSIAAGQGGMALKSFGNIEQKADLGIDIGSHEGIKISTKGRPYKGKGVFKVLRKLGDALPNPALKAFMSQVQAKFSNVSLDPNKMFTIDIENENGDIFLHTGKPLKPGASSTEGDIMFHVEGEGSVKAFTNEGQFHAWSGKEGSEGGIVLEVGERKKADKNKRLATDVFGSRISQTDKEVNVFAKEKVRISSDDYVRGKSFVEITKGDQIEIKCGQASIVMKKNGDITFKGNNIKIEGMGDVDVKGRAVTSEAQTSNSLSGMDVAVEGDIMCGLKGKMVMVDGKMTDVKGSLIKIGA